jgi:hypothetical protein
MWISVYNQGINIFEDNKTMTKITKSDEVDYPLPTDSIRVIKSFNDQIVLGTDVGIGYFDYDLKAYIPWKNFQNKYIYDIEIIDDHQMWIGTGKNGIYYYNYNNKFQPLFLVLLLKMLTNYLNN